MVTELGATLRKQNKSLIAHCDVQISGFGGKRGTKEVYGIIYLEVAKPQALLFPVLINFLSLSETQSILTFLLLSPTCSQGTPKLPNITICHHTDGVTSQQIQAIGAGNGRSQVRVYFSGEY